MKYTNMQHPVKYNNWDPVKITKHIKKQRNVAHKEEGNLLFEIYQLTQMIESVEQTKPLQNSNSPEASPAPFMGPFPFPGGQGLWDGKSAPQEPAPLTMSGSGSSLPWLSELPGPWGWVFRL